MAMAMTAEQIAEKIFLDRVRVLYETWMPHVVYITPQQATWLRPNTAHLTWLYGSIARKDERDLVTIGNVTFRFKDKLPDEPTVLDFTGGA